MIFDYLKPWWTVAEAAAYLSESCDSIERRMRVGATDVRKGEIRARRMLSPGKRPALRVVGADVLQILPLPNTGGQNG